MIAAFLPPFRFRGMRAPYLWVFYKLLTAFRDESLIFITGADYRLHYDELKKEGARWEFDPLALDRLGYKIPSEQDLRDHIFCDLSDQAYIELLQDSKGNPSRAFEKFLTEINSTLSLELEKEINNQSREVDIEAVLSICNCPSLEAVCARRSIPVIHLELGPLREPEYRYTAYFDFKGVNGGSEAAERYARSADFFENVSSDELFKFFSIDLKKELDVSVEGEAGGRLGVVLQVEDDSNIIAYSNGFDAKDLLAIAKMRNLSEEPILVRPHPSALFVPKEVNLEIDRSPSARAFLMRCKEVLTVNSSVALEALLLSGEVEILGDASYAFIQKYSADERNKRLCFYLFCYLVPFQLAFSPEYIRFRLRKPSEQEICTCHLSYYLFGCSEKMNDSFNLMIRQSLKISELRKNLELVLAQFGDLMGELRREMIVGAENSGARLGGEKLIESKFDALNLKFRELEEIYGIRKD